MLRCIYKYLLACEIAMNISAYKHGLVEETNIYVFNHLGQEGVNKLYLMNMEITILISLCIC